MKMTTNGYHSPAQNRRQFTRINFKSPAQIFTGEQTVTAQVNDVSLKGTLVEIDATSDWRPVAGNHCEIVISLDDSSIKIYMHARVAHVTDNRMIGLLCEHIDLESIGHLRKLVELNLGDPTLLERELKILESMGTDG
jgi:PilZ domain